MRPLIPLVLSLLAPSALADDTPAASAPTPSEDTKPADAAKPHDANAPDAKSPDAKPSDANAPGDAPPADANAARKAPTTFSTIDPSTVPDKCASHARFANGLLRASAVSSRLSLANCLVGPALEPIKSVLDSQESMLTLERAVARSIELYDEVIALGDPARQVLAASAKAQLYQDLLGRMAQAVPPPSGGEAGMSLYQSRKSILEIMLEPWRTEQLASYERVIAVGKANPALVRKHAAMRDAVARAEQQMQVAVAAKAAAEAAKAQAAATEPQPASKLPAGATAAPANAPTTRPPAPAKGKQPTPPKDDGASAPAAPSSATRSTSAH